MSRALITGASSGIGWACAEMLAAQKTNLILVARRKQRLTELAAQLSIDHGVDVRIVAVDICKPKEVESAFKPIQEALAETDILINNAGLAKGTAKMQDARLDDWDAMIDTNIKGLLYVTHLILPYMMSAARGHIVNIGSVAGRWTYPGGAVYCASKFAVRALTEGLRLDLNGTPLRVTNIEPGMVETEFSNVRLEDDAKAKAVYKGFTPLSARDVAEAIVWSLNRPPHVNIQELVLYPTAQASVQLVHRK